MEKWNRAIRELGITVHQYNQWVNGRLVVYRLDPATDQYVAIP